MKSLLIILDGMEDAGIPSLGGQSPLEASASRWPSHMEARGRLSTTPPGREADSQTCILTLLGVAPELIPKGRAALEAAAAGFPAEKEDLLLRCNLVEIKGGKLRSSCLDASHWAGKLIERVSEYPGCELFYMGGFQFLLKLRGMGNQCEALVTFPPHQHIGEQYGCLRPQGGPADLLWEISRDTCRMLETAALHPWSEGVNGSLPRWEELWRISAALVAEVAVVRGIGLEMGIPCPSVKGATGDTDTDLAAKSAMAEELLGEHDLVIVHVGGADEAAHRRDPREKTDFLARVDRELLLPLILRFPEANMLVCSDHITLCESGKHDAAPVRFWLRNCGKSGELPHYGGEQAIRLLIGG